MKTFSVARAFSAGVDLIERKPWTIAWWALAVIVLEFAPRYILSAASGSNELGAMHEMFGAVINSHDPAQIRAASDHLRQAQGGMQAWGMLWSLWGLFCSAVLYNAAYRSVLEPQKSSFGYLRIGVAELWQFLVLVVLTAITIVYAVICVVIFLFAAGIAKAMGPPASGWIIGITLAVLVLFTYWLMLRFSLGTVATFAQRRFAYFDSWNLTKGRVWKLFWTGFLLLALVIGLYVMFLFSAIVTAIPLTGMLREMTGAAQAGGAAVAAHPGVAGAEFFNLATLGIAVWLSLIALVTAVVQAFTLTPWAVAYQAMTAPDDPAH